MFLFALKFWLNVVGVFFVVMASWYVDVPDKVVACWILIFFGAAFFTLATSLRQSREGDRLGD